MDEPNYRDSQGGESTAVIVPYQDNYGSPLTLAECRQAAEQMRSWYYMDRDYYPWIVESLCNKVAALEQEVARMKKQKGS